MRPRITENYFIQVAQETGIIGAMIFVLFCTAISWRLIKSKRNWLTYAALGMWFGGLLVNMLWPAWTDETTSVILFAVVGYVIGGQAAAQKSSRRGKQTEV